MSRKRDRLEVIYDILKIIRDKNNSIKPTPLLRYSNLSSQSFSEYYDELMKKELIKEVIDKKGRRYITLTW
ncbi:MAG: winged helix-turn-helix domain-containing protein [Nanoarchaeota archaeon]|nr:winged helix-turn-helix domain-containing protein [Nanoarchaeota archaeon]